MASARQKQIKVDHLTKQVDRLDRRLLKAKDDVVTATEAVKVLEQNREAMVDRLKWQQAEPVNEDDEGDE